MHLIEFKGRNSSVHHNLNLLYSTDKAFIMDNHLAASWCWTQKIDTTQQYNLFHIDRHYDLLNSEIDWWIEELNSKNFDMKSTTIEDLLAINYAPKINPTNEKFPLFRWDNYLTIFNQLYPELLDSIYFATHKDGTKIDDFDIIEEDIYDLPENLAYWINSHSEKKWIVNVDIDYFYRDRNGKYFQFLTDDYILIIADELKKAWDNIEVLTIALSPELCGTWNNAEKSAKLLIDSLGLDWFE